MKDLESELKQIKELKNDLSRVIVVQEEEKHLSYATMPGVRGLMEYPYTFGVPFYVIDKPGITKPDTETQHAARGKLLSIYWLSPYSRVRYKAARALDYPIKQILQEEFRRMLEIF